MTAAILGAIVMVLCWPRLRGVGVPHDSEPLHAVAAPTVIAATVAWSVTIPALLAYIAMRMWVGADEVASTCAAAACATGATFPTAAAWRAARRCDGAGGTLVAHAGAWCLPVAACVLVSAIVMMRLGAAGDNGSAGGAPAAAMFAAVGAVCAACACAPLVGRWLAPPDVSEAAPAPSRAWRGATIDALTAATVAITVASIDPFSWDFVWAAAIFALIAEDGRWLAGWAACYLQGTHSSRDAARVGAMLEENSRPMIAVVAAATAIGAMTAQDAALLCAAAWALDLTWGVRRLISVAPARQVPQE
jgi:Kef-type K+ transport system membrane component KefB